MWALPSPAGREPASPRHPRSPAGVLRGVTRGPRGFLQRRVLFAESSRADVDWLTGTRVGDEVPQVCLGPVSRLAVESPLCLRNPWAQDRERERRQVTGWQGQLFTKLPAVTHTLGNIFRNRQPPCPQSSLSGSLSACGALPRGSAARVRPAPARPGP